MKASGIVYLYNLKTWDKNNIPFLILNQRTMARKNLLEANLLVYSDITLLH